MAATTLSAVDKILASAFESAGFAEDDIFESKGFIPTGNLAFDYVLGGSGLPRGRTAEFYGLSQSAKTSAACTIATEAQRMGLLVCYFDYEQALDERYLNAMGVKTRDKSLFRAFPAGSLEAGCDVAVDLARTGEVGLMVFDSVPAMVPRSSAEDDKDSRTLAMERARLLGNFLSKLNPILARTGSTVIFINHIRDVIETGPTRPGMPKRTTTPGGSALKFYSSVRVKFGVVKQFNSEQADPLTGGVIKVAHSILTKVEVTKNKVAAPFKSAELYVELGRGFSNAYSAIQVLIGNGVVRKNGSFFVFPEDLYHPSMTQGTKGPTVQGMNNILNLASDPEWLDRLSRRAVASLPREEIVLSTPDVETDGEDPIQNSDDDVLSAEDELPTAPLSPQLQPASKPVLRTSFSSGSRGDLQPGMAVMDLTK